MRLMAEALGVCDSVKQEFVPLPLYTLQTANATSPFCDCLKLN